MVVDGGGDTDPGLGPPPHRHDWDEAYYVLEGVLDFVIDGLPVRVEPGGFTYLPRNTVHSFKGASPSPARVLIFAVPAHSSAFFKDVDREVRTVPDDLAKVPAIGLRHGIEFMPAPSPAGPPESIPSPAPSRDRTSAVTCRIVRHQSWRSRIPGAEPPSTRASRACPACAGTLP